MKDTDFIGQMVHETIESENPNKSSLLSFKPEVDGEVWVGLDEVRKCYIIQHKQKSLEVPFNWGPFKNRISKEIILDIHEDTHHFIEVFNVYFQTNYQSMKLNLDKNWEKFQGNKAA